MAGFGISGVELLYSTATVSVNSDLLMMMMAT
jgi:hypothetical protein